VDYDKFVPRNSEGCFFFLVLTHCEHLAEMYMVYMMSSLQRS
jgi:hypothetical protein